MNQDNNLFCYLTEVREHMRSAQVQEIDFDTLHERLGELLVQLESRKHDLAELGILRDDYCRRITGMLKAIAVAGRRQDALAEAHARIESLESLSAEELVALYRRTQARFHDAFPSSFGVARPIMSAKSKDEFKSFK